MIHLVLKQKQVRAMSKRLVRRFGFLLFSVAVGFHNCCAQTARIFPFEGVIEMQIQDLVNLEIMSYSVSGHKVRIESKLSSPSDPYFIIDTFEKKAYLVLNARDAYVEIPLGAETSDLMQSPPSKDRFVRTGESRMILGLPASKWVLTEEEQLTEIWATPSLGTYVGMQLQPAQETVASFAWESELKSRGLFPLRVTQLNEVGSVTYQLEVLSVTRRAISDAVFHVPPGYEKTDLPVSKSRRQ